MPPVGGLRAMRAEGRFATGKSLRPHTRPQETRRDRGRGKQPYWVNRRIRARTSGWTLPAGTVQPKDTIRRSDPGDM